MAFLFMEVRSKIGLKMSPVWRNDSSPKLSQINLARHILMTASMSILDKTIKIVLRNSTLRWYIFCSVNCSGFFFQSTKLHFSLECKNFIIIPPSHQHFLAIWLVVFDKIDQNNQNNRSVCFKMFVRWWDEYEIFTF